MISLEKEHIEYNGDNRARLILKGQWLYDSITLMPVQIFAINYDYYYEIDKADGFLEKECKPELNEHGEQYLFVWHGNKYFSWSGSFAYGGLTLEEEKKEAQKIVQNRIKWDEPSTKNYL